MRNTAILPGRSSLDELIAGVEDGYLLLDTSNGQADATTEFMFGVNLAYEIRGGKLGRAVRDTTLSGSAAEGAAERGRRGQRDEAGAATATAARSSRWWCRWAAPRCGPARTWGVNEHEPSPRLCRRHHRPGCAGRAARGAVSSTPRSASATPSRCELNLAHNEPSLLRSNEVAQAHRHRHRRRPSRVGRGQRPVSDEGVATAGRRAVDQRRCVGTAQDEANAVSVRPAGCAWPRARSEAQTPRRWPRRCAELLAWRAGHTRRR